MSDQDALAIADELFGYPERGGPVDETCKCSYCRYARARADHEPSVNVMPIAKCGVEDGKLSWMEMLAPGLPDGEHDLFPATKTPECKHLPAQAAWCPRCSGEPDGQ